MDDIEEKKDKIESVENALYSRNADRLFVKRRHALGGDTGTQSSAWQPLPETSHSTMKLSYTKILFGAFIFFVLAIGFSFFKFFGGSNTLSGDNIAITASGPVSISGGEVIPLNIDIKNNNVSALQNVSLLVQYPDGSVDPNNLSTLLPRYTELLGTVNSGADLTRLVKAAVFGQQNSQETIKIIVSYNIAGSSATFNKEKDYTFVISSSPVNIAVTGPTEVSVNQQSQFTITVTSNSLSVLPNVVLQATYPFGFNFVSSDPAPAQASGNSTFDLGDLSPGGSKTVTLNGNIVGQDGEERVVHFVVGNLSAGSSVITTPFNVSSLDISIKKSSIGVATQINGNSADTVPISAGGKVDVSMNWQNNLADKVTNMSITASLSGDTLDRTSVNVPNGFYNSSNNSIVFDKSTNQGFQTVNPGDGDTLTFNFSTLLPAYNPTTAFAGSQLTMNIVVTGDTTAGTDQVLYTGTKTLQITSDLNLLARGFRTVGPFTNTGPFPPQVNQKSTYTIIWTATNSFNNINNAIVSATLPANIQWLGMTSPSTENISYNQSSGQITWNVGNMKAGTGTTYPPHEVAFQVAVTPSVTRVGQDISLLGQSTITGTDAYSNAAITENGPEVTTNVDSDPQYVDGIGKVTQ